jgi:hypothetical protein
MQPQPQPQPQPQQQLQGIHPISALVSPGVQIDFERTASCRGSFNESKAHDELFQRIRGLGREYFGAYTVLVGDLANLFGGIPFSWKPHDPRQRGLGFVLGDTTDGTVVFPARCFSLVPPAGVDLGEMWYLLNDRRAVARPKLAAVPSAPKEEFMPIPAGDNPLALGLAKHALHQKRLDEATAEREALLIEIPELEAQAASLPTVKQRVAERLKEYGLEP